MEGKETKTVYFIYSQNGEKSNIKAIDLDNKIKEAKEISKEVSGNSIQILYRLKISKNKESRIKISLLDKQEISYNSFISLNSNELFGDENYDTDNYIIYNVKFKPYSNNEENHLDQNILPCNKQFNIFENNFKNDQHNLITLYKTTIFQVFLQSNQKLDFILDFFLKTHYNTKKLLEDLTI